jgi:hypothetical protein
MAGSPADLSVSLSYHSGGKGCKFVGNGEGAQDKFRKRLEKARNISKKIRKSLDKWTGNRI